MTLNTELLFAKNPVAGGYQIERSLRFNSSDSAYLSRTPASAGNRKTWTWAGWVKRSSSSAGGTHGLFLAGANPDRWTIQILEDVLYVGGSLGGVDRNISWVGVLRDFSAWYHIVVACDTTQSVSTDRFNVYLNGTQITTYGNSSGIPAQNTDLPINNTVAHQIGNDNASGGRYFNGYLADVHFIDGQALDPTSFGEFDTNGVWQPIEYAGSYGTNGFHLPFSDNSTAAALGTDTSGNGNNWTVNNISVAAGAGNDSLVDTPTSYGTDTGAGGEVRGNYCTWNPLANGAGTLTNGNLDLGNSSPDTRCNSTISVFSGKWYYEITLNTLGTNSSAGIGQNQITNAWPGNDALSYAFELDNARTANNSALVSYGSALVAGDIFMCAFDLDNNKIFFGKNGTWFNSSDPAAGTNPAFTLSDGSYCPIGRPYGGGSFSLNTGQRPFAYTAPSGFKALCTTNLPDPVVAKPSEVMDVKLYTGNGSTQTISGLGFSPDLVWIKKRNSGLNSNHLLADTVRGVSTFLSSSGTFAESTFDATWRSAWGDLTAFNSDGFTVVAGSSSDDNINDSPNTHVAWTWDAGSSTVTNTQGSITSQVRANPSAGFSVVTYTGTGSQATIGHGLNAAPGLIIAKRRDSTSNWDVYHSSLGKDNTIFLNSTSAVIADSNHWGTSTPNSTVFGAIGAGAANNAASGSLQVAYCFAPVAGYSSGFSYTGNGSSDGPMVWLGFRPRFIIYKRTDVSGYSWAMFDSVRNSANLTTQYLLADTSGAEQNGDSVSAALDLVSNGFKIRSTGAGTNASGGTYVGFAFAEHPFQYARAR